MKYLFLFVLSILFNNVEAQQHTVVKHQRINYPDFDATTTTIKYAKFPGLFQYEVAIDTENVSIVNIEVDELDSLAVTLRMPNHKFGFDTVFIEGSGYYSSVLPIKFKENSQEYVFFKSEFKRFCRFGIAAIQLGRTTNTIFFSLNQSVANSYIDQLVKQYLHANFDSSSSRNQWTIAKDSLSYFRANNAALTLSNLAAISDNRIMLMVTQLLFTIMDVPL
jgi:hypothetical protein